MNINSLNNFSNVIDEFKKLKINNDFSVPSFYKVINDLKLLKLKLRPQKNKLDIQKSFFELTEQFILLKNNVIEFRKKETEIIIEKNKHKLKLSTFELMEHNFRENSHSNVLKYIFDYKCTGDVGALLLSAFVADLNDNKISDLSEKLLKKNYTIVREKFTGKGRIDLLIEDAKNKFVIVIENKILAEISNIQNENLAENTVKLTQLDFYKEYILENNSYKNWESLFIVLSYKYINHFSDSHFKYTNYNELYKNIVSIETNDTIINEYKILLHSLMNNTVNKTWLIDLVKNTTNINTRLSLNKLELINLFLK